MMKKSLVFLSTTAVLLMAVQSVSGDADPVSSLSATIIVDNTADTGPGSLRQAIIDAIVNPGPDTVAFAIPKTDPGFDSVMGVWTIQPASFLPALSGDETVIDGRTQAEFVGEDTNPLGPEIEIDGTNAGTNGFGFYLSGEANQVLYLAINRFDGAGIYTYEAAWGYVAGCYIGTDATGRVAAGNLFGVAIDAGSVRMHVVPLDTVPNVICGNKTAGISMNDSSKHNIILGNLIGVTSDRSDTLGNGWGGVSVLNNSDSNQVIDCWIGGSVSGVGIGRAHGNTIVNNFIGTSPDRQTQLGNTENGIVITQGSKYNRVIENVISHNAWNGIQVSDSSTMYNTLSRNGISRNTLEGIYLRRGANMDMAAPVILTATANQITGTASAGDTVECFADPEDEGEIYLGTALADGSGDFTLTLGQPIPPLGYVTATARDASGNTSGFSSAFAYTPTSVESEGALPREFTLSQNYPNPFNPSTVIGFALPEKAFVRLEVVNVAGQRLAILVDTEMESGYHEAVFSAEKLSSGIYFYRLTAAAGTGRSFTSVR
ncbi:MAG: right-handed parallel beta-helix repeat-containing protein, partial [Bacteroidota bacterium]